MKKLTYIAILLLGFFPLLNAQQFESNLTKAQERTTQENKTMMMVFSGSDWCKPCILLKRDILTSPEFASYADENLVLLYLDFPSRRKNELSEEQKAHNEALAERYNPTGVFPLVLILNEDQTVAQRIEYKMNMEAETFIQHIKLPAPALGQLTPQTANQ